MRGISIKAIALATLAVLGVDVIAGFMLASYFGGEEFGDAVTDEQILAVSKKLLADRAYLVAILVEGTASTVLGGYLAARLARIVPYFNALAFGVLSLVLGAAMSGEVPTWFRVIGLSLTIPAALAGGYLWKQSLARAHS
jgi:hypothetical protein